jgi:hypothetical protein
MRCYIIEEIIEQEGDIPCRESVLSLSNWTVQWLAGLVKRTYSPLPEWVFIQVDRTESAHPTTVSKRFCNSDGYRKRESEMKLLSSERRLITEPGVIPRTVAINRKLNHHSNGTWRKRYTFEPPSIFLCWRLKTGENMSVMKRS